MDQEKNSMWILNGGNSGDKKRKCTYTGGNCTEIDYGLVKKEQK